MKDLCKKLLICFVLLACLCGLGWMVWAHRGVIMAMIKGEPLPEAPESCPFGKKEKEEE